MVESPDAKTIFLRAVEFTAREDREQYLQDACQGNLEFRRRVDALLAAHDSPDTFLERPLIDDQHHAGAPLTIAPVQECPGAVIGAYKLLEELGQGGMGVVFMAEQTEPVRRRVALKIIRPGMDSAQVIARFEAERQALAMMDHPHIARVFDAGTTETGRPYFVMELVKGVPITEYCDRNKLNPQERLNLLIPVCEAIQHAHQKGIIHRDVKPSNVLVCLYDGKPVPKVIDFGVAKAVEQRLTERTMFTQHGQIVGTLEYMSPEQAEMNQLDVDTRSDVYSLGVLLYELLTGSTPITKEQLRAAGLVDMLRMIRESEPDRPSARINQQRDQLASISAQRRIEPDKLGAMMRGELDWIVMKALEKDRTRRYASATDLARDIQRYLNDEPVDACPPSAWYSFVKVARRHRTALSVAAAIAGILVVATLFSTSQAIRANNARRQALANLQALQQMSDTAESEKQRALSAERESREQSEEATAQQRRAERAEQTAMEDRDRAVRSEQATQAARDRAEQVTVEAIQTLGHSAYHHARTLLSSNQTGRRWGAIDAVSMANEFQSITQQDLTPWSNEDPNLNLVDKPAIWALMNNYQGVVGTKPTECQLRSAAVAALLERDGRVAIRRRQADSPNNIPIPMEWEGHAHAVSPDGSYVASTSFALGQAAPNLRIIATESDREIIVPPMPPGTVPLTTALTAGGTRLAVFSLARMNIVDIYDLSQSAGSTALVVPPVASDRESESASASDDEAQNAAVLNLSSILENLRFSPDGNWLIATRRASLEEIEILLWDLRSSNSNRCTSLAIVDLRPQLQPDFSADSRFATWIDETGTVVIWNLTNASVERRVEIPYRLDGAIAFSQNGGRIVVHGRNPEESHTGVPTSPGRLVVWDLEQGRSIMEVVTNPTFIATSIDVSVDEQYIAASQMNGEILVADVSDAHVIRLDHGSLPTLLAWTPSNQLVSAGFGSGKVWELSLKTPLSNLHLNGNHIDHSVARFTVIPTQNQVAVEFINGEAVGRYDLDSGNLVGEFKIEGNTVLPANGLVASPSGGQLARVGHDRVVVWQTDRDSPPLQIDEREVYAGSMVTSVGFSRDGTAILSGFDQFHPVVKDSTTGKPIWRSDQQQRRAMPQLSEDGGLLVVHTEEELGKGRRSIEIRKMPTGEVVSRVPSTRAQFNAQTVVRISPDKRWLIEIELPLNLPIGPLGQNALTQSITSHLIGATSQSWQATIWDVATGIEQLTLEGASAAESIAFSRSGRYLAVGLRSGELALWDVEAKRQLFTWAAWKGPADLITATRHLAFSDNDRHLIVAAESGAALRRLDLEALNQQLHASKLGW